MPSYLYKCPQCTHQEEVFHSISADVHITCPDCLVELVRKPQFESIKLKGKGFYSTGG